MLGENSQMGWSMKKQKSYGNLITILDWLHILFSINHNCQTCKSI